MRKSIILFTLLFVGGWAFAQRNSAVISDVSVTPASDYINISFTASIPKNATKSSYTLFLVPTITDGTSRLPLSPIVVQGRRARIAEERYAMSKSYPGLGQPLLIKPGSQVRYTISAPIQSWMTTVQLVMEKYSRGCCNDIALPSDIIARNIVLGGQPQAEMVPVVPYVLVDEADLCLTTADKLARRFAFVEPFAQFEMAKRKSSGQLFDYNMPLNLGRGITRSQQYDLDLFIEQNRDQALSIYYRQGIHTVDRYFADNNYALIDLVSCIRAIQSSPDSRIVRIVIAGYASPEGSFLFNDRLAWERAVSIKEIILNNTNLDNRAVSIYNGSVDWRGLFDLVAKSDMYHKYQVLNIINGAPIYSETPHQSRLEQLKNLDRGEPYRYMLNNIFPLLRNASYVKVYYQNISNPCFPQQQYIEMIPAHEMIGVPVQTIPVQALPVQSVPTQVVPAQTVPVQIVPVQNIQRQQNNNFIY